MNFIVVFQLRISNKTLFFLLLSFFFRFQTLSVSYEGHFSDNYPVSVDVMTQ